jgi:hypothetical protein
MIFALTSLTFAFDPSKPHKNKGILPPISSAPKAVSLSDSEVSKLKNGDVVLQSAVDENTQSGRGVAVQYINAREERVWNTILNYPKYPDWVDNVVECNVYKEESSIKYVEMISSVMWVKFGVYTKNHIYKDQKYMHWTLDYSRLSDADDLIGYWRVEQIQDSPPITRVDYATDMKLSGVPDFLGSYLTKDALINGTKWVKREAEK